MGTGDSVPRSKVVYILPSRTVAENLWSYTTTHPFVYMARCLIKHNDNFTFSYVTSMRLLNVVLIEFGYPKCPTLAGSAWRPDIPTYSFSCFSSVPAGTR
jgi:hypothetical protein